MKWRLCCVAVSAKRLDEDVATAGRGDSDPAWGWLLDRRPVRNRRERGRVEAAGDISIELDRIVVSAGVRNPAGVARGRAAAGVDGCPVGDAGGAGWSGRSLGAAKRGARVLRD